MSNPTKPREGATGRGFDPRARVEGRSLTWVDANGRALAARVDFPADREAVGAVVVVPSIGQEFIVSFRTTRALTMHAAQAGFVGITFAFSGHGDSHPLPSDADALSAWQEDLAAVSELARRILGDDRPVHFVGLRVGAAILRTLPADGAGIRLLWEPISGSSYLRQHRAIRQYTVSVPPVADHVELEGHVLTPKQAAALKRLHVPRRAGTLQGNEVLRLESDQEVARRLALGSLYHALLPLGAIREIVGCLTPGGKGSLALWQPVREATLVMPDGCQVKEVLCDIGPHQLSAVLCKPVAGTIRIGMCLTAMGSEIKSGPGGLWARTARELASAGVMSVRADRSGLGEDIDPCRIDEPRPYVESSVSDVQESVAFLRAHIDRSTPVWASGICAGAWSVFRAAARGGIDRVIAINSIHWNPDPNVYTEAFYERFHRERPVHAVAGATAVIPPTGLLRRARWVARRATQVGRRKVADIFPSIPLLLRPDVPRDAVGMLLSPIPPSCQVELVMGENEEVMLRAKGGRIALAFARRRRVHIRTHVSGSIDHALMSEAGRRTIIEILRDLCVNGPEAHRHPASTHLDMRSADR